MALGTIGPREGAKIRTGIEHLSNKPRTALVR